MNYTMLADLCPCFHRLPTKLCPDLVSFACWIVPKLKLVNYKRFGANFTLNEIYTFLNKTNYSLNIARDVGTCIHESSIYTVLHSNA